MSKLIIPVMSLFIAFIGAAPPMHAADLTITSGTVLASYSAGGSPPVGSVQIQGDKFALSGSGLLGNATVATPNVTGPRVTSITFIPAMSETLSGLPFVFAGTALKLLYQGATYNDQNDGFIVVAMSFSGPRVTAPNTVTDAAAGKYNASVSNVPFSMTGILTVHSGSATGPVLVSVPISGSGLYTSTQQGSPDVTPTGNARYQFQPPSPTQFGLDTSAQGAWTGKYGTEGYLIANGPSSMPAYAVVSFAGETRYTWVTQTPDPRALQSDLGSSTGMASAYTQDASKSFTINAKFTDGKIHQVALYLLDWDTFTRSETITIKDVATDTVLDAETLSTFHEGYYATWNLQGNVSITVTPKAGTSPAVSGVFFDPAGGSLPVSGFALSALPATIAAGSSGASMVTVLAANGFVSPVGLAASGWPAGITGTFATNPTLTTSAIAISVGSDVVPGAYPLTINGTAGTLNASTTIALTVTVPDGPTVFKVSASAVTVAAGSSGFSTLTANPALVSGDIDASVTTPSPWPPGIALLPSNGNTTLGINVAIYVTPGVYMLPISVHNGILKLDATTTIALTVTAGPTLNSSAAYVGLDSATQGAWNGKYGADGFMIANGTSSLPAYGSVIVTGAPTYTWAALTPDVRALQTAKGSTDGIASSYYARTFNINVDVTDGNIHQVGLYFLDWDSTVRSQRVVIMDAVTNAILDGQSFSGFQDGQWAVWNVKGSVIIQVTTVNGGADAVVSGIFFDPVVGGTPATLRRDRVAGPR